MVKKIKDSNKNEKKLYRTKKDRIIFGVCSGLSQYFNVDVTLIRLVFILLAFMSGIGVGIYIILAIVTPIDPNEKIESRRDDNLKDFVDDLKTKTKSLAQEIRVKDKKKFSGRSFLGFIIAALGLILLIQEVFNVYMMDIDIFWPVLIIALGLYILLKSE